MRPTWIETIMSLPDCPDWLASVTAGTVGVRAWHGEETEPSNASMWWVGLNPLGSGRPMLGQLIENAPSGTTIACWSGTLGESLFDRAPMNWIGPGTERLLECLEDIRNRANERRVRILLQPHVRHVMSDVPSTISLLRSIGALSDSGVVNATCPVGLALSPASFFEADMLDDTADFLHRIGSALGKAASIVILNHVAFDRETDRVVEVNEAEKAALSVDQQQALIDEFGPSATRVVCRAAPADKPGIQVGP